MKIESLEVNIFKASEIKEGDIVLVRITEEEKLKLNKEKIRSIYEKITGILKKEIPIYFFPSNLNFEIIKQTIENSKNLEEATKTNEKN